jgi:hypothetical protein
MHDLMPPAWFNAYVPAAHCALLLAADAPRIEPDVTLNVNRQLPVAKSPPALSRAASDVTLGHLLKDPSLNQVVLMRSAREPFSTMTRNVMLLASVLVVDAAAVGAESTLTNA